MSNLIVSRGSLYRYEDLIVRYLLKKNVMLIFQIIGTIMKMCMVVLAFYNL